MRGKMWRGLVWEEDPALTLMEVGEPLAIWGLLFEAINLRQGAPQNPENYTPSLGIITY